MREYGKYKSRDELTKDELLSALTRIQEIKHTTSGAVCLDSSKLSPVNMYCLTGIGISGKAGHFNLPYIDALSAADSEECSREFRDNMADLGAELLDTLKTIQNDITSIYEKQREVIAKEEASLIERLKLVP